MSALAIQTEEQSIDMMYRVKTKDIQKLLLDVGFPHHVYGYNYISYALELIMLDPEMLEMVPSDGVILAEITVVFYEGESVFDVLQRVCRENNIHMEAS